MEGEMTISGVREGWSWKERWNEDQVQGATGLHNSVHDGGLSLTLHVV